MIVLPEMIWNVDVEERTRVSYEMVTSRVRIYRAMHLVTRRVKRTHTTKVFVRCVKLVITGDSRPWRTFVIRNQTRPQMVELIRREGAAGASWSTAPSQDQRRLVSEDA